MRPISLRRCFLILLTIACSCFGQSISIGLKGGVRTTTDIPFDSPLSDSESRPYVVGPMVQISLPFGFGAEIDALYRRNGYRFAYTLGTLAGSNTRGRSNSVEFPMLLQYALKVPVVKPYIEGGWAPRIDRGYEDSAGYYLGSPIAETYYTSHTDKNVTSQGIVAGGGVRIRVGRLEVAPEVRYTRWTSSRFGVTFSDGPQIESLQNQVDVLVGIGWRVKE